jgi:hypothetical protein
MGLLWNSNATIDMIELINHEFSQDTSLPGMDGDIPPIKKWKRLKATFYGNDDLTKIAKDNKFFGGGKVGTPHDISWQSWLYNLGNHNQPNSHHEKLRRAILDGLNNYNEIVFAVIPTSKSKLHVDEDSVDDVKTIIVYTPTAQVLTAYIRKRKAAIAKYKKVKIKKAKM